MKTRLMLLLSMVLVTSGCEDKVPEPTPTARPSNLPVNEPPKPPKALMSEDISVGEGPAVVVGDKVKVHYTGRLLKNNKKFDSSLDRKEPFGFTVGKREVIKGWDQGLLGMKVGGARKLTIPSDLAYGEQGSPPKIGPNEALVFEIELLEIEGKGEAAAGGAK